MGQSTEELKRDIEHTRADMSGTLDAIEDRVSPSRMIQRRKNRVAESVHALRERVMGAASEMEHGVAAAAGDVTDTIKDAPHAVARGTEGAPMVAGGDRLRARFPARSGVPGDRRGARGVDQGRRQARARQTGADELRQGGRREPEGARQAGRPRGQGRSQRERQRRLVHRPRGGRGDEAAGVRVSRRRAGQSNAACARRGDVQATVAAGGHQVGPSEVEGPNSF